MSLGVKSQSSSASLGDCRSQLALSPGPARSFTLGGKGGKSQCGFARLENQEKGSS